MPYDSAFYDTYSDESERSAAAFAALLVDALAPQSVLDVGCGIGTWLRAFQTAGVEAIVGVDGPYVDRDQLLRLAAPMMKTGYGQYLAKLAG